jgi:hypothetical protein
VKPPFLAMRSVWLAIAVAASACFAVGSGQVVPPDWVPRVNGAHMLFSPYGDSNISSPEV